MTRLVKEGGILRWRINSADAIEMGEEEIQRLIDFQFKKLGVSLPYGLVWAKTMKEFHSEATGSTERMYRWEAKPMYYWLPKPKEEDLTEYKAA